MKVKFYTLSIIIFGELFCLTDISYSAILYGKSYRLSMTEISDVANSSAPKTTSDYSYTGIGYSLLGSVVSLGAISMSGATYSAFIGVMASYRPPQDHVDTSYAYPNPCNLKKGCNGVSFTRLTLKCEIKIYNISGEHIITINKDSNDEKIGWDLKNKNGNYVSSGLYIYYIKGSDGSTKKGKLVIVR